MSPYPEYALPNSDKYSVADRDLPDKKRQLTLSGPADATTVSSHGYRLGMVLDMLKKCYRPGKVLAVDRLCGLARILIRDS